MAVEKRSWKIRGRLVLWFLLLFIDDVIGFSFFFVFGPIWVPKNLSSFQIGRAHV